MHLDTHTLESPRKSPATCPGSNAHPDCWSVSCPPVTACSFVMCNVSIYAAFATQFLSHGTGLKRRRPCLGHLWQALRGNIRSIPGLLGTGQSPGTSPSPINSDVIMKLFICVLYVHKGMHTQGHTHVDRHSTCGDIQTRGALQTHVETGRWAGTKT